MLANREVENRAEQTYVKSYWNQGNASPASEELINYHILWPDPGDKCEDAQKLCNCRRISFNPIHAFGKGPVKL
jgi:hypothetical protein